MEFSVYDIYDKTLYAKTRVPIRALPQDSAPIIEWVEPGQIVGKVHTHYAPATDRKFIYWGFIAEDGSWYYAPHQSGLYNLSALREQGLLSIEEKVEREKTTAERVTDTLVKGIIAYGVIRVAGRMFF